MISKCVGIPFSHLYTFVLIRMETELTHQQVSLLRRNYLHIGIFLQYLLNAGRVVGFQVIDDYPVERTSVQHVFQIFLKLSVGRPVHRIEEDRLLV